MPLHSLELVLTPVDDARVRADWEALARVGPSQAQHRGATNAPHATVLSTPGIAAAQEQLAAAAWGPALPARVRVVGLVALGRGPFTLAWLLSPDASVVAAAQRCRREVGDAFDGAWLPHVTLARRVPAPALPAAVEVMAARPCAELTIAGLRRWDPDTATVRVLLASTDSVATEGS
ncbi:hypothetical protein [Arsenicicoccus dermatophilus]|uniref:hypothetical protein n=1 Tax=Arsenicicoccus dermatophilus TaxID=1076331 RepID=UPI00391766E9